MCIRDRLTMRVDVYRVALFGIVQSDVANGISFIKLHVSELHLGFSSQKIYNRGSYSHKAISTRLAWKKIGAKVQIYIDCK